MAFLDVLGVTKRRRTGTFGFGGKMFDLPKFLRHYHTIFNMNVLQSDDSAFLPQLFLIFPRITGDSCPRLVRQCYQSTCLF